MVDIDLKLRKATELRDEKEQLNKEIESWSNIIAYLSDKNAELEVQIIPDQIQVLTLLQAYRTKLDALKESQEEVKKKASDLDTEIKNIKNMRKDIEEQVILHQKKESYYIEALEQINEEITERVH